MIGSLQSHLNDLLVSVLLNVSMLNGDNVMLLLVLEIIRVKLHRFPVGIFLSRRDERRVLKHGQKNFFTAVVYERSSITGVIY
jgi:hypothetical protein